MGRWEDYLEGRLPQWLKGTYGERLATVAGGLIDAVEDGMIYATKVALLEDCPDDAVEPHARARLLERLPDEPIAALRKRALKAWEFWSTITGAVELRDWMRTVSGVSGLEIYDWANDAWYSGYSVALDDDENQDNASRLTMVLPQPHPWERTVIGLDIVVGPETLVGLTMTASVLSRIRAAFAKHRPANMVGLDIYLLFDGTTAKAVRLDHEASSDFMRIPLQVQMVGYSHHEMVVGPAMVVGKVFQ